MKPSIAQTSDCVLAMVGSKPYEESPTAKEYLSKIDFSGVKKALKEFLKICSYYPEVILNRKYAIQKILFSFLKEKPNAQIIILGAGLDPCSLLVQDKSPNTKIFEVEKIHALQKRKIIHSIKNTPNLHICEADISAPIQVQQSLKAANYKHDLPTIIIAEGISYYVEKENFWNTIQGINPKDTSKKLILEYLVPSEKIAEEVRHMPKQVFEKICKDYNMSNYFTYDHIELNKVSTDLGIRLDEILNMKDIEKKRTGQNKFFPKENSSWIYISTWTI